MKRFPLFVVLVLCVAQASEARCGRPRRKSCGATYRYSTCRGYQPSVAPVQAMPGAQPRTFEYPVHRQSSPQAPAEMQAPSDPYGFGEWLNTYRAQAGLPPLAYDPNASAWAATNNANGGGHGVRTMGTWQNWGMGAAGQVWPMWAASPAHRAALLAPASSYGIAMNGGQWTFNAN